MQVQVKTEIFIWQNISDNFKTQNYDSGMFNRIFTKSIIISEGGWVVSKLTSEPPKIFQYYIFGHKFSFCEEKIQLF